MKADLNLKLSLLYVILFSLNESNKISQSENDR